MSLLAVVNPSRRRRRRKASKARRRHARRPMTAKQLKFFGPRRKRRVRRSRTITVNANPARRSRRSARRSARRFRRNPVAAMSARTPRFNLGYITNAATDAATGAAGAVVTDLAMAQAARFLPATMTSRFNADGALNFGYVGVKAGLAVGLGVLGSQFLPGKARSFVAKGAVGALTVQAYEIIRAMLPADLVLGYMSPAPIAGTRRMAAYMATRRGNRMSAYLSPPAPLPPMMPASETRIGEGAIS